MMGTDSNFLVLDCDSIVSVEILEHIMFSFVMRLNEAHVSVRVCNDLVVW